MCLVRMLLDAQEKRVVVDHPPRRDEGDAHCFD